MSVDKLSRRAGEVNVAWIEGLELTVLSVKTRLAGLRERSRAPLMLPASPMRTLAEHVGLELVHTISETNGRFKTRNFD